MWSVSPWICAKSQSRSYVLLLNVKEQTIRSVGEQKHAMIFVNSFPAQAKISMRGDFCLTVDMIALINHGQLRRCCGL